MLLPFPVRASKRGSAGGGSTTNRVLKVAPGPAETIALATLEGGGEQPMSQAGNGLFRVLRFRLKVRFTGPS